MATRPDSAAQLQLRQEVVRPRFLAWLDLVGEPIRATTWPTSLTPAGTGDPELDGHEFMALEPTLVDVGPVKFGESGADTVTFSLSGLILPDEELLNTIGDTANWQGRVARLWQGVADAAWAPQGTIWAYYTGYIVNMKMDVEPEGAKVRVQVENYLASLSPPSLRNYLDQKEFDPEDESAAAAIAVANGGFATGVSTPTSGGSGGGRTTTASYLYERMQSR